MNKLQKDQIVIEDGSVVPIGVDKYGFPVPGKVVKEYRKRMMYIDPVDGKTKHWTQADLARRLGITEIMVALMETKNKGLDSIERRRALVTILRIPPILLGLASLEEHAEIQSNKSLETANVPVVIDTSHTPEDAFRLYKEVFHLYNTMQNKSTASHAVSEIENWILKIENDVQNTKSKKKLLYLLWEFHRLLVKIYSHDICNWNIVTRHLNEGLKIARELNDLNLRALTLNQSCEAHIFSGNIDFARIDIDAALASTKNTSPAINALIFANAARTRVLTAIDLADEMSIGRFLDQSRALLKGPLQSDERYVPAYVEPVKCLMTQANAYKMDGKVARAMDVLDDAERLIPPGDRRRSALLYLGRAKCYLSSKQPEYEMAMALLSDSFGIIKDAFSVHGIEEIEKLYTQIAKSSYGNAPEVIDMGMALRELQYKRGQRI